MNRNPLNPQRLKFLPLLRLNHPPLLINLNIRLLQPPQHIPALILRRQIQHLPKHRTRAIQMRRRRKRHEELAPVYRSSGCALRSRCCPILHGPRRHREDSPRVVL